MQNIKDFISYIWQYILIRIQRNYAAEMSKNHCWKEPDTGKVKGSTKAAQL
jgi:hypothetical protein